MAGWRLLAVALAISVHWGCALRGPYPPDSSDCTCSKNLWHQYPWVSSCPPQAVTNCHGGRHGFGNQLTILITHYAWALDRNLTFCPTPWVRMEHGIDAAEMYRFVGGDHYGPPATFAMQGHWSTRAQHVSRDALKAVRKFYHLGPKPTVDFHRGDFNVAWHIRRGDTSYPVESSLIKRGIAYLVTLQPRVHTIHFFTDGTADLSRDLSRFCRKLPGKNAVLAPERTPSPALRCVFHRKEPLEKDFHSMVVASVLVTAWKSTLSRTAAMLNDGLVYRDVDLGARNAKPLDHEALHADWYSAHTESMLLNSVPRCFSLEHPHFSGGHREVAWKAKLGKERADSGPREG